MALPSLGRGSLRLFVTLVCALLVLVFPSGESAAYPGNVALAPGAPDSNGGLSYGYVTTAAIGGLNGGCTNCHDLFGSPGAAPQNLKINGTDLGSTPTFSVQTNSTTTFTLTFTPGAGKANGGFLVFHNDASDDDTNGTLSPADPAVEHSCKGAASATAGPTHCAATLPNGAGQKGNTDVMHEMPLATGADGLVTFQFKYTAPAACGTYPFRTWIANVNGDLRCFNELDYPISGNFNIQVGCAASPDACHAAPTCVSGSCSYAPLTGNPCDDGNACTHTDHCAAGSCGGTALTCTTDACNTRTCDGSPSCHVVPRTGNSCDDGNFCDGVDTCNSSGVCAHSGDPCLPLNTSDSNCSTSCDQGTDSCVGPDPSLTACNDGFSCTTSDRCDGSGTCSGTANGSCDDGNPCTADSCSPATSGHDTAGCIHTKLTNTTTVCSDGDACTQTDSCNAGVCTGSNAVVCPTPDVCHTAGTCNSSTGICSNPAKADNTACGSDGNVCTNDFCVGGVCHTSLPDGTVCQAAVCDPLPSPPQAKAQTKCQGGACSVVTTPCASGFCNGANTACQGACGTDADCTAAGTFCDLATGSCKAQVGPGKACSRSGMCTGGRTCVDSVCCNSACGNGDPNDCQKCDATGTCQSLDGTPCNDRNACTDDDICTVGSCSGPTAHVCNDANPCTVDACDSLVGCTATPGNAGAVCRSSLGVCDPAESCSGSSASCPANQLDKTSACGSPSCTNGTETRAVSCSGTGAGCPAATTHDCAPYGCAATACKTSCSVDTDCAQGNYCATNKTCVAKGDNGASCSAGDQCLSTFCTDGVCCSDDCQGQCQACNLPNKKGQCSAVTGAPVAPRAGCTGDGSACTGRCNGVDTQACSMPGNGVTCRAPSCDPVTNHAVRSETCNGSGSCPSRPTVDCGAQVCGPIQCQGCATDAQCGAGKACSGGVCVVLTGNGVQCSRDGECGSAHCVDGVCCSGDCSGQCEACNLAGSKGTCTAVGAGNAPVGTRAACAGSLTPCGGTCDGVTRRACVYPGPGTVCQEAKCEGNRATLPSFCNGSGKCPASEERDCPNGATCNGSACAGAVNSCTSDASCNRDEYCAGGVCAEKKDAGAGCNTVAECSSGLCVDGVCCTSACDGQCEACDVVGSEGTCTPVSSGSAPHGSRQACAGVDAPCAGTCNGSTRDRCGYSGATVACRTASCADGLATLSATCQGNGLCGPLQQQACPVACATGGNLCAGGCSTDANCGATEWCSGGVCVAKVANGGSCGASAQCANGHCVDGVCCATACDGQCESCDQPGTRGTCSPAAGAPRSGRPACRGAGTCGGFCDGTQGGACALPGPDVTCGVGFCTNGAASPTPTCNGNATCLVKSAVSCDPYSCNASGAACLSDCLADAECVPGLVCVGQECVVPSPDGGTLPERDAGAPSDGGRTSAAGGAADDSGAPRSAGAGGAGGGASVGGARSHTDAGVPARTGVDAGTPADAGAARSSDTGSCGCRLAGNKQSPRRTISSALLLAGVVALRRRRGQRAKGRPVGR